MSVYIEVYLMDGCKLCEEMKKALRRPAFNEHTLHVYNVKGNSRINLNTKKETPVSPNITEFPTVVILATKAKMLKGHEAIEFVKYGALYYEKTISSLCPHRKFRKCAGPKCQFWTVQKMDNIVPVIGCATSWNVELLAHITGIANDIKNVMDEMKVKLISVEKIVKKDMNKEE